MFLDKIWHIIMILKAHLDMQGLPTVGRVLLFLPPFYFFGNTIETLLNTVIIYVKKEFSIVVIIINNNNITISFP